MTPSLVLAIVGCVLTFLGFIPITFILSIIGLSLALREPRENQHRSVSIIINAIVLGVSLLPLLALGLLLLIGVVASGLML